MTCTCLLLAWEAFAQTGLDKTATQIASEMMPGWNLGNTMEAARNYAITWETPNRPAVEVFTNDGGLESGNNVARNRDHTRGDRLCEELWFQVCQNTMLMGMGTYQ